MIDTADKKPLLRGYFHEASFYIALGACSVLIAMASNQRELIALIIYSLSVLNLFGISALYHRIQWSKSKRALMRKLDHSAIYLVIAGSTTAVSMIVLSAESNKTLMIVVWSVAFAGIVKSIFLTNLPKVFNAILFLIAGYIIVPYLPEIRDSIGNLNLALIIGNGGLSSIGALVYGLKKPNFFPGIFGYHELFHLLVSLGAALQFMVVYSIVTT